MIKELRTKPWITRALGEGDTQDPLSINMPPFSKDAGCEFVLALLPSGERFYVNTEGFAYPRYMARIPRHWDLTPALPAKAPASPPRPRKKASPPRLYAVMVNAPETPRTVHSLHTSKKAAKAATENSSGYLEACEVICMNPLDVKRL